MGVNEHVNVNDTKTWEEVKGFVINALIAKIQQAKSNEILDYVNLYFRIVL